MKTKAHGGCGARDRIRIVCNSISDEDSYYSGARGMLVHFDDVRGKWLINFDGRGTGNRRTRGMQYVPETAFVICRPQNPAPEF